MSEGIALPSVTRGTVLPVEARVARLNEAVPQILAVLEGESDVVALQSTLAALLFQTLVQASWAGFYRRVGESTLAVGPYQGSMGCLRIDFARGVCGACARTGLPQLVPDVRAFAGHIACDAGASSELVLPVVMSGRLEAVLDLDSHVLDAFSVEEQRVIEALLPRVFGSVSLQRQ